MTTMIEDQQPQPQQQQYLLQRFIQSIKAKATQQMYVYALQKYTFGFRKYTSYEDLLLKTNRDPKLIEDNIIEYVIWLDTDQHVNAATIIVYISPVIRFYRKNGIVLNRGNISDYIPESKKHKDRAYTTEEIQRLLKFCDERSQALVLLLASSGIRIGAVENLRYKHLKKIEDYQLYRLTVYEGAKEEYITFTTPEAAAAIDNYLDYRKRYGEKLTPESPLIREQFDINDQFQINKPEAIKTDALEKLIAQKLKKSGIIPLAKETENESTSTKRGRKRNEVATTHGFKKFVITNMIRAKVNPECREMMVDHNIDLSEAYYRPQEEEILQEYVKVIPFLTISDENRLKQENLQLKTKDQSEIELLQSQHIQAEKKIKRLERSVHSLSGMARQLIMEQIEEKCLPRWTKERKAAFERGKKKFYSEHPELLPGSRCADCPS